MFVWVQGAAAAQFSAPVTAVAVMYGEAVKLANGKCTHPVNDFKNKSIVPENNAFICLNFTQNVGYSNYIIN